jgi:hypothetical protein
MLDAVRLPRDGADGGQPEPRATDSRRAAGAHPT